MGATFRHPILAFDDPGFIAWSRRHAVTLWATAADGEPLAAHYKRHGLFTLADHATWPDGSVSTEAGILEMDEREKSGRLKIASHLSDYLEERRFYHRKDGQIVKLKDDLLSATRICVMMKRYGRTLPLGSAGAPRNTQTLATGTDFDVFSGGALFP
mgnify:CR=1 FL=1